METSEWVIKFNGFFLRADIEIHENQIVVKLRNHMVDIIKTSLILLQGSNI